MSDETEMLSTRVPEELKRLVDADKRTNQEVVRAALWREFGGERKASIDRRIEEKENRINMIEREKNERERELEQEQTELEALKAKREKIEGKEQREIDAVIDKAENIPADPSHPHFVEAESVDMTPEELAKAAAEEYNKEYDPYDNA